MSGCPGSIGGGGGGGFWWRLVTAALVTAMVAAAISCATRAHAQALIVADACAPGYCNNSLVGSYPALKILYRATTATEAEFATDLPNLARFAEAQRVSLMLERGAPEAVRTTFLPLLESSLGPDVMQWQGIQVMQPSLYNLDAEADAGNWSQLFSAQLLATVTAADGSLYGVPTLQRSWGIWYKKSTLADAGVAAFPVGWDDFLALLTMLNATAPPPGRAPLCISYGDGWQAQTWVSFLIGRVGGNTAWQRLLAMESDISADADVIEAWQRVAQLLPFFQGGAAALTKTFGDTLVDYVEQRCALLLSYGITRSFPAVLGAVNDDYTWGAFPDVNAALDAGERGEFSGFLVWSVNANARMLDAALAFVRVPDAVCRQPRRRPARHDRPLPAHHRPRGQALCRAAAGRAQPLEFCRRGAADVCALREAADHRRVHGRLLAGSNSATMGAGAPAAGVGDRRRSDICAGNVQ
jgi:ABC-type glycerol-3-phosphate transport system substrate-binding protein